MVAADDSEPAGHTLGPPALQHGLVGLHFPHGHLLRCHRHARQTHWPPVLPGAQLPSTADDGSVVCKGLACRPQWLSIKHCCVHGKSAVFIISIILTRFSCLEARCGRQSVSICYAQSAWTASENQRVLCRTPCEDALGSSFVWDTTEIYILVVVQFEQCPLGPCWLQSILSMLVWYFRDWKGPQPP